MGIAEIFSVAIIILFSALGWFMGAGAIIYFGLSVIDAIKRKHRRAPSPLHPKSQFWLLEDRHA